MRRIIFVLVAVAALGRAAVTMVAASGQTDGEVAPIYGIKIPPGYRDWQLISVAREEGNFNDLRAQLGNDVAIRAYRDGTLPFPDGSIIVALHWNYVASEENNKAFGRSQSFVAGSRRTFSSWSRTQRNTPRRAAGGSLISRMANPQTRRCIKPASRATSPSKLATLSLPATHRETE